MESQVELNKERSRLVGKLGEALPDLMALERPVIDKAYQAGEISTKIKRLMSMALALGSGCTNCILGQANQALKEGATTGEILETLAVVISMRGTTGIAESLRIIRLLEETGQL